MAGERAVISIRALSLAVLGLVGCAPAAPRVQLTRPTPSAVGSTPGATPIPLAKTRAASVGERETPFYAAATSAEWFALWSFQNITVVQLGARSFQLRGAEFTPLPAQFMRGLPSDGQIAFVAGNFPEQAWLVWELDEPCAPEPPTELYQWAGSRWIMREKLEVDGLRPVERHVAICTWGPHQLALINRSAGSERSGTRLALLDAPAAAAPRLTPEAVDSESCTTMLQATSCVELPTGDLIVLGYLCKGTLPAIEHFSPGASSGRVRHLSAPAGARSLSITSPAVSGGMLYLGGSSSSPNAAYLARLSSASGDLQVEPTPKQMPAIQHMIATPDGSLWIAPLQEDRQGPDGHALRPGPTELWRRSASGVWHAVTFPIELDDVEPPWQMPGMGTLQSASGELAFVASYTQARRGRRPLVKNFLYRVGASQKTWLAPGPRALPEPETISLRDPCMP